MPPGNRVCASWDQPAGRVAPKSGAGKRTVPIIGKLRDLLTEHRILSGRSTGLVFGRSESIPFNSSTVNARAARAWKATNLAPIGLHEARHTTEFADHVDAFEVPRQALVVPLTTAAA